MRPGTVHRSPGSYLAAEEDPGKPQLGGDLMKVMRPDIASNGGPMLPNKVGKIAGHEGKKEGKDGCYTYTSFFPQAITLVWTCICCEFKILSPLTYCESLLIDRSWL